MNEYYHLNGTVIAVDFDGTVVSHEYPAVGRSIGAEPVLRELVEAGALIVLNTMRSGMELEDAVRWFRLHGIPLYGVNENPTQKGWTSSPKVYAQVYVDDAALGCPLKTAPDTHRPFVDWKKVRAMLLKKKPVHP